MKNLINLLSQNIGKIILVVLIALIFLINTFHESYPDEFDNILGGWYILHGRLPYTGFFTHHGPIPYFIAALATFFSGQSFVNFRIFYALILLIITFLSYFILRNRIGKENLSFYPAFIVFLAVASTYYWSQMILADNIAAFTLLPVYALIILKTVLKIKFWLIDLFIISFLSAMSLYSSLTYIYLYLICIFFALYLYYHDNGFYHLERKKILYPLIILALPHLIFLAYLILTKSLNDYIYQNFVFNAKYYIYNYPKTPGSDFINPVRYAILISHFFFMNFYTLLIGFKTFDFVFPINTAMAVANTGLIIYLLFKKHYKLAAFVLFCLIFTSVRSDPLRSAERDYQSAAYNFFSFFNIFFLLPQLFKDLNEKIDTGKKVIFGFLLIVVGLYSFFASYHLYLRFSEKTVSKYQGTMPLIYDRPKLTPVVNLLVSKDEYMWIGPFEFEELFYANGKIPSKYHILIKGVGASEKTSKEMLSDFNKNKPKIIMFDKNFSYLGNITQDYSPIFMKFLQDNYVTLANYRKGDLRYLSVLPISKGEKLDLENKMYIRIDAVEEVTAKLLEKNYIKISANY